MTHTEDAVSRLTAWIRDYGDQKQPEFIADLNAVLAISRTPADQSQAIVTGLPSRVIQIQAIHISASVNNGDYTELIALCEDGSMWTQYHSNGYANVPTNGKWHELHSASDQ